MGLRVSDAEVRDQDPQQPPLEFRVTLSGAAKFCKGHSEKVIRNSYCKARLQLSFPTSSYNPIIPLSGR